MAGVKQFDEAKVLDQAMTLFWERGFEATSIDDLAAATGVKRGSLYHAFGAKEALFLKALDRYLETVAGPIRRNLDGPDARAAIAAWLAAHRAHLMRVETPRGCLVTNAAQELAQREDAVGRKLREVLTASEAKLYQTLLRAQADGQLAPGQDLLALARFLHGTIRGMALMHKATGDPAVSADMAKVALEIFDGEVKKGRPAA